MVKPRVGLVRGDDRRANIFRALDLVREDVVPKLRSQVMLKPNCLSGDNQLASSHADALRGVLDFLMTVPNRPDEVIVAEAGNEKVPGEAFRNFDYYGLDGAYPIPIHFVDLHQETLWQEVAIVMADGAAETVKMPRTVLDCPCTISVAIAKTHDVCVVTLALKNMIMGTIYKPDRIKMHGFQVHSERMLPAEAKVLNVNLIRLARYLCPDIAVIDGFRGLQGNGPGGTDGVEFGVAAAGVDVYATDAIVAQAMGFEPMQLGLLQYAHQLGLGIADPAEIDVLQTQVREVQKAFKPHEKTPLQMQWQAPELAEYLIAS